MSIESAELTYTGPLTEPGELNPQLAYFVLRFIRNHPNCNDQADFIVKVNDGDGFSDTYTGTVTREEFLADDSFRACFFGLAILAVDGVLDGSHLHSRGLWNRASDLVGVEARVLASTASRELEGYIPRIFGPEPEVL